MSLKLKFSFKGFHFELIYFQSSVNFSAKMNAENYFQRFPVVAETLERSCKIRKKIPWKWPYVIHISDDVILPSQSSCLLDHAPHLNFPYWELTIHSYRKSLWICKCKEETTR
jgi:hypothetical protein